jgi:hypothetical protein
MVGWWLSKVATNRGYHIAVVKVVTKPSLVSNLALNNKIITPELRKITL